MNPFPSSTNKRVTFSEPNKVQINYRLLYQLHSTNNSGGNEEVIWKSISNSYNFIANSEYSWKELKNVWDRAPAMTKRKIGLESVEESEFDDSSKKPKKNPCKKPATNQSSVLVISKPTADDKPKIASILKNSNTAMPKHVIPNKNIADLYSLTSKTENLIETKTAQSSIINEKVKHESKVISTENKSIQTEFVDINDELAQRDMKLKISIQEMKLKFLQSQYRRRFGDSDQ